jgi:hypothetical protein
MLLATFGRAPDAARKEKSMLSRPLFALAGLVLIVSGCAKDNDTPPAAAPTAYPAAGQPVAPAAYPQPAVTAATPGAPAALPAAPAAVPATPAAPAASGTMATPNAFALPCQNDQSCGFAKCNVQFQKCAFPCQGAVDCAAGASCNTVTGLCLPGGAPQ